MKHVFEAGDREILSTALAYGHIFDGGRHDVLGRALRGLIGNNGLRDGSVPWYASLTQTLNRVDRLTGEQFAAMHDLLMEMLKEWLEVEERYGSDGELLYQWRVLTQEGALIAIRTALRVVLNSDAAIPAPPTEGTP